MIELLLSFAALAAIVWPASLISLSIIHATGNTFKQLAIDTIEVVVRWEQAKADSSKRQAELDYWTDKARLELHTQRRKLLDG